MDTFWTCICSPDSAISFLESHPEGIGFGGKPSRVIRWTKPLRGSGTAEPLDGIETTESTHGAVQDKTGAMDNNRIGLHEWDYVRSINAWIDGVHL